MKKQKITGEELINLKSADQLRQLLSEKEIDTAAVDRILDYESDLKLLQIELVKLQQWVLNNRKRVIIIFEGRDAAGKGGIIRRFTEHLNPRSVRQVALNKPTEIERGQWYFRRYVKHLPNRGEIVFFDRSWYNRAVVEPVMGFCDEQQYNQFIHKVPEFEHMLYEDGVTIIKFWLSISKTEQLKRFNSRNESPLKRWKFSPVDQKGQELWDKYTYYKEQMFSKTHASYSPWIIVKTNDKMAARLESIRYVLSQFDYDNKKEANMQLIPDPNIIIRYFRSSRHNKD